MSSILGLEEKALKLCEERAGILSHNIANVSTPNYKARDFDFQKALKQATEHSQLITTHKNHVHTMSNKSSIGGQPLQYRVPMQEKLDQNTVDDELERKNFMENSLHYQANLNFVQGKYAQLMKAIKGE
ncbi:flagellar basal body rod protein FlgB [Legionella nagasakiensis]|uniref:flagellar basal body rod protein FlgB n=1 Tax=Legionella nagasakiensis TaxID=535290 RepID=UPI001056B75D|nr:flagellar basal body rod protein FlgB [Legionella nagasakiensis]